LGYLKNQLIKQPLAEDTNTAALDSIHQLVFELVSIICDIDITKREAVVLSSAEQTKNLRLIEKLRFFEINASI